MRHYQVFGLSSNNTPRQRYLKSVLKGDALFFFISGIYSLQRTKIKKSSIEQNVSESTMVETNFIACFYSRGPKHFQVAMKTVFSHCSHFSLPFITPFHVLLLSVVHC
jgi:hypothetical protein